MSFNKFLDRQRSKLSRDKPRHLSGYSLPGHHLHGFFWDSLELIAPVRDDAQRSKQQQQVKDIKASLSKRDLGGFSEDDIIYALRLPFTEGSTNKTVALLEIIHDSEEMVVRDYDDSIILRGAVNRGAVSCYLDSILFAMFAQLKSFESMLLYRLEDRRRNHLAALLRLWVNLQRSGYLVTTDITREILEALGRCGWKDATQKRQQDALEAFTFILEQLGFPDLHLKMDIFHSGKEDKNDDHKIVRERVLVMPLPEPHKDGSPIKLEDCFELALIARIDVRRKYEQERRATISSIRSPQSIDFSKGAAVHVEAVEVSPSEPNTPILENAVSNDSPSRLSSSFIHERVVEDKFLEAGEDLGRAQKRGRGRSKSLRKEVLMPAWQMYSLIPFHTEEEPKSDNEVVQHLREKQPTFCIALKRYSFSKNGHASRRDDYVDIPLDMVLPHFIQDNSSKDSNRLFENFKISLQSLVCHRGVHVDSGHYVSLVRVSGLDGGSKWLLSDDLAGQRVKEIDIHKALKEEMPYLLFYRVEPTHETIVPTDGQALHVSTEASGRSPEASKTSFEDESGTEQRSLAEQSFPDVPPARSESRGRSSTPQERALDGTAANLRNRSVANDTTSNTASLSTVPQHSMDSTTGKSLASVSINSAPVSRHGSRLSRATKPRSRGTSAEPAFIIDRPRVSGSRNRLSGLFASPHSITSTRSENIMSNSASATESISAQTEAKPQIPPRPEVTDVPRLLRRDHEHNHEKDREKARNRLSIPGTLPKARRGDSRPERECTVM